MLEDQMNAARLMRAADVCAIALEPDAPQRAKSPKATSMLAAAHPAPAALPAPLSTKAASVVVVKVSVVVWGVVVILVSVTAWGVVEVYVVNVLVVTVLPVTVVLVSEVEVSVAKVVVTVDVAELVAVVVVLGSTCKSMQ